MKLASLTWLCPLLLGACSIGEKVDPALIPERPTYAEDIAPILDSYCTACHDADGPLGAIDGVDLSSYDEVVAEFREVELEVGADSMPPRVGADSMPPSGKGLTGLEKATLERWSKQGFPP
jgi:hypothetical protein